MTPLQQKIMIALKAGKLNLGEISQQTGQPARFCQQALRELRTAGHVKNFEQGKWGQSDVFTRAAATAK